MADDPIIEPGFLGGVKVVTIGDLRVARGLSRRPYSSCSHRALIYDQSERRIWCQDCEKDVDHFAAFIHLVEQYDGAPAQMAARAMRGELRRGV